MSPRPRESRFSPQLSVISSRPDDAGLFLDIDGVLAAIRTHPAEAFVPTEVRDAVARLACIYRLVAVVSGRALADARRIVGLDGITVVGNHGMEIKQDGAVEVYSDRGTLARVEAALQQLLRRKDLADAGVRIEPKGGSVALHTRGTRDQAWAWRVAVAAAQSVSSENDLVFLPGRAVIDVRPPGVNKGSAVRLLAEREGLRAALYLGDDRTDIDAFRAMREMRDRELEVALNIAVLSEEAPPGLAESADLVITFSQVIGLLRTLLSDARSARGRSESPAQ